MSKIIGRTITFIRTTWPNGYHAKCKNEQFTGVVLDKITGWDIYEEKRYLANYYLVELPGGILEKFLCDEAKVIHPKESLPLESLKESST